MKLKTGKYLFLILIVALCFYNNGGVFGQNNQFTQYYLNPATINPAFSGIDPFFSTFIGYKQLWNGFDNGNDIFHASAFSSIGKTPPAAFKNNSLRVSDPKTFARLSNDKSIKRRHGIGGFIESSSIGPYQSTQFGVKYAYHIPVSNKLSIAFGTSVDMIQDELDFSSYTVRDPQNDSFYQQLVGSQGNQNSLKVDFGGVLYSNSWFLGISSNSLVRELLSGDDFTEFVSLTSYDLLVGKQFVMSPTINVFSSARVTQHDFYGFSWELTGRMRFRDVLSFGASYYSEDRISALFGLTPKEGISINYSYDYFVSDLNSFNSGNHEVVLGLALFNRYSFPKRFW
ncbi:type IX secretion system membrane protein PorP/SprF [Fulvivirga sp. M361]|uniref:PorP/SprF family type IX secretion system membrane protein n=1 Tax=Fulvivirga sp. M361 TaxID=2594266 RepID=UPI001179BC23|nr:PorP/SprF family type IX secretion system membrane protein [Fulvivirga sp. M361]TRX60102.1 type IX secretion system membrane protein PorP/SprF [Fulvivirga sp. M361]